MVSYLLIIFTFHFYVRLGKVFLLPFRFIKIRTVIVILLEDASTPIYLSETQSAFVGATVGVFVLVVIGVVTAVFIIR